MRYLFGDSSESDLDVNYLALLRDAVDFGVAVLVADAGLIAAREKRLVRDKESVEAARSVEEFGKAAAALTEPLAAGDAPINRCAASIAHAAADAVKREVGRVRAQLQQELESLDGETRALRDRCAQALGKLLATHDLPGASESVTVTWSGVAFGAKLRQHASFGVDATLALDVPAGSFYAHELRVEKVGDGIELRAPETKGLLKKETKMVPQKLARYFVTEVSVLPRSTMVKVRATLDANAPGFDITSSTVGVKVERAGDPDGAFATDERDVPVLQAFVAKLEEAARALRINRGAITEVLVDGKPLATHDSPRVVVERLVAAMAPTVAEIARHCLSPRELVLKRLLGGDRREEIFLSRAELTQKLEPLSILQRQVFAPLGLAEEPRPNPPPVRAPSPDIVTSAPDPHRAVTVPAPADHELPVEAKRPVTPPPAVAAPAPAPPAPAPPAPEPLPPKLPGPPEPEAVAEPASELDSSPSITIEADPPPARPTLPPLSAARPVKKTLPPPPPIAPAPVSAPAATPPPDPEATAAAVDAALRDLDDAH
jgi:hypothetical protein